MHGRSTKRLFVAIDLPDAHRTILADLQEPVRGVSWTSPEQFHLTLRFLGETDSDDQKAITRRLKTLQVEPFILPLENVGVFPPRGQSRIIWSGVGHGHPRLYQLRQQIDDSLLATGIAIDLRTYVAHITLGRCVRAKPGPIDAYIRKHRDFQGPPFRVDRFSLYSSQLTPTGAIHTVEAAFPLRDA
jgi:2'-5' RNA ligase